MEKNILSYAWDGEWFLRAYDALGGKVGSKDCEEGRIYIEPQGFCVMAGIGVKEGLAHRALESVRRHLTSRFGIELLTPCYTRYYKELGEISSYPPGYKENGSVFCHNNPWISIAETVLGNGEEAFTAYCRIAPAFLEQYSEIHRTEPYVYSQMIAGRDAPRYGEAKNSWLTGTAAWAFVNVSQSILGIYPDYDGLRIAPCLPYALHTYRLTRYFRGAEYFITVHAGTGTHSMTVDGKPVEGDLVPYEEGKATYEVVLTL